MLIEDGIMDNNQSFTYECEHIPLPSVGKRKAFFAYLICRLRDMHKMRCPHPHA